MGARDLLAELTGAGFTVAADGERLVIRPASLLTDDMRAALRASKPDLLALLAGRPRPYRLTPKQADRAHAAPWDDEACSVFISRVTLFIRRGLDVGDADDLAERLCLRDLDADNRALCLECSSLAGTVSNGWRCCRARVAGVAASLPAELVTQLQRCPAHSTRERS